MARRKTWWSEYLKQGREVVERKRKRIEIPEELKVYVPEEKQKKWYYPWKPKPSPKRIDTSYWQEASNILRKRDSYKTYLRETEFGSPPEAAYIKSLKPLLPKDFIKKKEREGWFDKVLDELKTVGSGFLSGSAGLIANVMAKAGYAHMDVLEELGVPTPYPKKDVKEFFAERAKAIDLQQRYLKEKYGSEDKTSSFVYDLASGVGSLAVSVGLAMFTGPQVPAVLFGINRAADVYYRLDNELKKENVYKKAGISVGAGLTEGVLEGIGLKYFLGAKGGVVRRTVMRAAEEGLQETAQELGGGTWLKIAGDQTPFRQVLKEAAYEGVIGALVGGGSSVVIDGIQFNYTKKYIREAYPDLGEEQVNKLAKKVYYNSKMTALLEAYDLLEEANMDNEIKKAALEGVKKRIEETSKHIVPKTRDRVAVDIIKNELTPFSEVDGVKTGALGIKHTEKAFSGAADIVYAKTDTGFKPYIPILLTNDGINEFALIKDTPSSFVMINTLTGEIYDKTRSASYDEAMSNFSTLRELGPLSETAVLASYLNAQEISPRYDTEDAVARKIPYTLSYFRNIKSLPDPAYTKIVRETKQEGEKAARKKARPEKKAKATTEKARQETRKKVEKEKPAEKVEKEKPAEKAKEEKAEKKKLPEEKPPVEAGEEIERGTEKERPEKETKEKPEEERAGKEEEREEREVKTEKPVEAERTAEKGEKVAGEKKRKTKKAAVKKKKTTRKKTVKSVIEDVMKFADRRSRVRAPKGVKFEAKNGRVYVAATNLFDFVIMELPIEAKEDGVVVVSAKGLEEALKTLGKDDIVSIEVANKDGVVFKTKNGKTIKLEEFLAPEEYGTTEKPENLVASFMANESFPELISRVIPAVSKDDTQPVLKGLHLNLKEGYIEATDARVLTRRNIKDVVKNLSLKSEKDICISGEFLKKFIKVAKNEEAEIEVYDNLVVFRTPGKTFYTKRLVDEYYNTDRLLGQLIADRKSEERVELRINVKELLELTKSAKEAGVLIEALKGNDYMTVRVLGEEREEIVEIIVPVFNGPVRDNAIVFVNGNNLHKAVQALGGDEILVNLETIEYGRYSPILIFPVGEKENDVSVLAPIEENDLINKYKKKAGILKEEGSEVYEHIEKLMREEKKTAEETVKAVLDFESSILEHPGGDAVLSVLTGSNPATGEAVTLDDIVEFINEAYPQFEYSISKAGTIMRAGKRAGLYHPGLGSVQLIKHNVEVLAHELAHAVDVGIEGKFEGKDFSKGLFQEVVNKTKLGYIIKRLPVSAKPRHAIKDEQELFATLYAAYVIDKRAFEAVDRNLMNAIEKRIESDRYFKTFTEMFSYLVNRYRTQPEEVLLAEKVQPSREGSRLSTGNRLYAKVFDDLYPLLEFDKKTGKPSRKKSEDNVYDYAYMAKATFAMAEANIFYEQSVVYFDKNGELTVLLSDELPYRFKHGNSLWKIIEKPVREKKVKEVLTYWVAQVNEERILLMEAKRELSKAISRVKERAKKKTDKEKVSLSAEEFMEELKKQEEEYVKKFGEEARKYFERAMELLFTRRNLRAIKNYFLNTGKGTLTGKEAVDFLRRARENIKKKLGDRYDFDGIVNDLTSYSNNLLYEGHVNNLVDDDYYRTSTMLYDYYAPQYPEVTFIGEQQKLDLLQLGVQEKRLYPLDMNIENPLIVLYKRTIQNKSTIFKRQMIRKMIERAKRYKNNNMVAVVDELDFEQGEGSIRKGLAQKTWIKDLGNGFYEFSDGEKIYRIEIKNKDLEYALREAGRDRLNEVLDRIARMTNFFKDMVTGVLDFTGANIIRDSGTILLNTRTNAVPFLHYFGTLRDMVLNRRTAREFAALGVTSSTLISQGHRITLDEFMEKVGMKPELMWKKVKKIPIGKLFDAMRSVAAMSEVVPRMTEYRRARQRGFSPMTAARFAQDVTINFSRTGRWTGFINVFSPFYNPSIQGFSMMVNLYTRRFPRTVAVMSLSFIPVIISYFSYWDRDEERRRKWLDIPPEIKMRYMIFEKLRIPIPEHFLPFYLPFLYLFEQSFKNSSEGQLLKAWFKDLYGTFIPDVYPIKTAYELEANYSFFYQRGIVPRSLQSLPPSEQYFWDTPRIYRAVGKLFNVSPIKVEYAVRNILGTGIYEYVVQLPDAIITDIVERNFDITAKPPVRRFVHDEYTGVRGHQVQKVYGNSDIANAKEQKLKRKVEQMLVEGYDREDIIDYVYSYIEKNPEVSYAYGLRVARERFSIFTKEIRKVQNNGLLTSQQKKKKIREINEKMSLYAVEVNGWYNGWWDFPEKDRKRLRKINLPFENYEKWVGDFVKNIEKQMKTQRKRWWQTTGEESEF